VTIVPNLPIEISYEAIADFCQRWKIARLGLFGSVVRDDFTSESDVDVLIYFAEPPHYGFRQWFAMEEELAELFQRPIDLLDWETIETSRNYLRRELILGSVKVLYERG
jgi:uncharacterized protein